MANERTAWHLTVALPSGQALFSISLESEPVQPDVESKPPTIGAAQNGPAAPRPSTSAEEGVEALMTEPQKRYLFRLLAQQGMDSRRAEEHLKGYFRVMTLRRVSKTAASQLIEQMVADRKEAGNGSP